MSQDISGINRISDTDQPLMFIDPTLLQPRRVTSHHQVKAAGHTAGEPDSS
mgnify:CR=1 FL=1